MISVVEKSGRNVQEAVALALAELNAAENEVDIEVLEEGGKGIFGLIGSKAARVRVTLKRQGAAAAVFFLHSVLDKMKVDVDITAEEDEESINLKIKGSESGIIIGRRGETLDALQYLTSLVVNKGKENYKKITIDIEDYRQKREETLARLADKIARKVVKYKKNVTLEPMNPYERRIIHASLQNSQYVETYSIGEEPFRKVVVALKNRNQNKKKNVP